MRLPVSDTGTADEVRGRPQYWPGGAPPALPACSLPADRAGRFGRARRAFGASEVRGQAASAGGGIVLEGRSADAVVRTCWTVVEA